MTAQQYDQRIAGRVPPHDLDAEAAVLSAILLSREALDRVMDRLRPEHFYSDANGRIYAAILQLAAAKTEIDIITVSSVMRDQELLARCGGASYLAQLADATPAVAHVGAHADVVREKWRLRRLIATCQKVAAEGYGQVGDVQLFIDGAEQAVHELAEGIERETAVSACTGLDEAFRQLDRAQATGEKMTGLPTGISELDTALAGLHRGDVTIIGGPTGRGKTSLALSIAHHVASTPGIDPEGQRVERGVLFVSLDNMLAPQLMMRLTCAQARVDSLRVRSRKADPAEWARLTEKRAALSSLPLLIEASRGLTPRDIRAKIRAAAISLRRTHAAELSLVVIDYFQLLRFDNPRPGPNKEQLLNETALAILDMAGAFGLPILLLAQLNARGLVRDCEVAEMHAQGRWTITTRDAAKRAGPPGMRAPVEACAATIDVVKAREGRLGPCSTNFYPPYTLFTDEVL